MENDAITVPDLEVFTDTSRAIIKTLEKNGYIEIVEKKVERNPFMHKVVEKSENLKTLLKELDRYDLQKMLSGW